MNGLIYQKNRLKEEVLNLAGHSWKKQDMKLQNSAMDVAYAKPSVHRIA